MPVAKPPEAHRLISQRERGDRVLRPIHFHESLVDVLRQCRRVAHSTECEQRVHLTLRDAERLGMTGAELLVRGVDQLRSNL